VFKSEHFLSEEEL